MPWPARCWVSCCVRTWGQGTPQTHPVFCTPSVAAWGGGGESSFPAQPSSVASKCLLSAMQREQAAKRSNWSLDWVSWFPLAQLCRAVIWLMPGIVSSLIVSTPISSFSFFPCWLIPPAWHCMRLLNLSINIWPPLNPKQVHRHLHHRSGIAEQAAHATGWNNNSTWSSKK